MTPTLLVLAAGSGSRYGRLKQLDNMGPSGEALFEYSIFDAIRAGFKKVVFVINKKIEYEFKSFIRNKFEDEIQVDFAYQEIDSFVSGDLPLAGRTKPWGTGQAVLAAKDVVADPFLMINADDFYGRSAFQIAIESMLSGETFFVVGYPVGKTLSEHGTVNRAQLKTDSRGNLLEIVERFGIFAENGRVYYLDMKKKHAFESPESLISMNIIGFPLSVFDDLKIRFGSFQKKKSKDLNAEFLAPNVINDMLAEGKTRVKVLACREQWFGVTFPEDKQHAQKALVDLIRNKRYPEKLWK